MNDDPATLRQMAHWRCFGVGGTGIRVNEKELGPMAKTQVAEAFDRAGYVTLKSVLEKAIADHPDNRGKAELEAWKVCQTSPTLMFELIGNQWRKLIEARMESVIREQRRHLDRKRAGSVGQKVVKAADQWQADEAARRAAYEDSWEGRASAAGVQRATGKLFSVIRETVDAAAAVAVEEYKRSCLFKFQINGRPIGEASAAEAAAWSASQSSKVAFVEMLISGISSGDNRPIKDIVGGAEADGLWQRAHGG